MPADNITRAIKKGTGELEGVNYEEATYEGYGPNGVALIVQCLTDNKNRTAGEVRSLFTKAGGNMGDTGSVGWMFERRGTIDVKPGPTEDQVMEVALDAGALDVITHSDGFEVRTEPNDLHKVVQALEKKRLAAGRAEDRLHPQGARQGGRAGGRPEDPEGRRPASRRTTTCRTSSATSRSMTSSWSNSPPSECVSRAW